MSEFRFDVSASDIEAAAGAISGRVRETPCYHSPALSELLGCETTIKLECLQLGGSFKVRGVLNRLLSMGPEERRRGVVTVSGGNHAIAVALAAGMLDIPAKVMMAKSTPKLNVELTRRHGAEVVLAADVGEAFALAQAEGEKGSVFLHPFDDPAIIAGHGTVGLEIAEAAKPTHVFVSIGGGGFISGVAAALKARIPDVSIIGVETVGATAMTDALAEGHPVTIKPTSMVTTLAPPFVTERTLAATRQFVDDVMVVSDRDAVDGVFALLDGERVVCEPAAGCVLAAAQRSAAIRSAGARVCLVLCGSNVDLVGLAGMRETIGAS